MFTVEFTNTETLNSVGKPKTAKTLEAALKIVADKVGDPAALSTDNYEQAAANHFFQAFCDAKGRELHCEIFA